MHVQRVAMPAWRTESWTVVGDNDAPVEPVARGALEAAGWFTGTAVSL